MNGLRLVLSSLAYLLERRSCCCEETLCGAFETPEFSGSKTSCGLGMDAKVGCSHWKTESKVQGLNAHGASQGKARVTRFLRS